MRMSGELLVVEDNDYLRAYMKKILGKEGYSVREAACGADALSVLRSSMFDAVLLDLDLGDMNGVEIIRLLRRQQSDIPVIVISNFEEIDTKVTAFKVGCDDYLTKPFYKEELLARLKRLQSRCVFHPLDQGDPLESMEQFGPFRIDYRACTVHKLDRKLELNRKLFDLFVYFCKHRDMVISREQLLQRFWKEQDAPSFNTLSVHIHMLRQQIESDAKHPAFLVTKRGLGYMFQIPSSC